MSSCYLLGPEPDDDFTKDSRSVQLGRQGPLLGDPGRNPRGGPAALWATRIFHGTSAGCFKLPPLISHGPQMFLRGPCEPAGTPLSRGRQTGGQVPTILGRGGCCWVHPKDSGGSWLEVTSWACPGTGQQGEASVPQGPLQGWEKGRAPRRGTASPKLAQPPSPPCRPSINEGCFHDLPRTPPLHFHHQVKHRSSVQSGFQSHNK